MPKIPNLPIKEIEQDILEHFGNVKNLIEITSSTTLSHNDEDKAVVTPVDQADWPDAAESLDFSFMIFVENKRICLQKWRTFPWRVVCYGLFYSKTQSKMWELGKDRIRRVYREDLSKPDATYGEWVLLDSVK